jgi:hypothetical protein
MKPIVEDLDIEKNNLNKWFAILFTATAVVAFFSTINKPGNQKWMFLGSSLVLAVIAWAIAKYRISVRQEGFTVYSLLSPKTILWTDINSIAYNAVMVGNSTELRLTISYGNPNKTFTVSVKQFKKQKMQRFFEILNEQCTQAVKNEHFIKQLAGKMSWRDQLKMYTS